MTSINSYSSTSYVQYQQKPNYFQYLDQDSDSSVNTEELEVMAEKLSELTGEDVSASDLMSQIDQDGDSELTGEELKAHMDTILGEPKDHPAMMMEGATKRDQMMGPGGPPPAGGPPPGGKPPEGAEGTEASSTDAVDALTALLEELNESAEESDSDSLLDYLYESEDEEAQSALTGIYQAMIQEGMSTFLGIQSNS